MIRIKQRHLISRAPHPIRCHFLLLLCYYEAPVPLCYCTPGCLYFITTNVIHSLLGHLSSSIFLSCLQLPHFKPGSLVHCSNSLILPTGNWRNWSEYNRTEVGLHCPETPA